MALPAGWYPVNGDPTGTHRYWDGERFTTPAETNPNYRHRTGSTKTARRNEMAGLSTRGLAFLIDLCAPALILAGMINATGWSMVPGNVGHVDYVRFAAVMTAFTVCNQILFVGWWGVSLGKAAMGLRVTRSDNAAVAPGILRATIRLLMWAVPAYPITALLWFYGNRRTVNDLAAGTLVIYG